MTATLGSPRRRGTRTVTRRTFPEKWLAATYCGAWYRLDDDWYNWSDDAGNRGLTFPNHATRSATRSQTSLLYRLAKRCGYQPPAGTCCQHQSTALISYLTWTLTDTGQPTHKHSSPQDSPTT